MTWNTSGQPSLQTFLLCAFRFDLQNDQKNVNIKRKRRQKWHFGSVGTSPFHAAPFTLWKVWKIQRQTKERERYSGEKGPSSMSCKDQTLRRSMQKSLLYERQKIYIHVKQSNLDTFFPLPNFIIIVSINLTQWISWWTSFLYKLSNFLFLK